MNLDEKNGSLEINNIHVKMSHNEFGLFDMCVFLIKKSLFRSRSIIDFNEFEIIQFKKIKPKLKNLYWYTQTLDRLDCFDNDDLKVNLSKLRSVIKPHLISEDQVDLIIPKFKRNTDDFYPISKIQISNSVIF